MAHIEGRNVIMMVDKGAGFVPALCAVSISINTTVETKEVMTVGDGSWRKPRPQKLGYNISLEGVTEWPLDPVDTYDTFNLLANQTGFTNLDFRIYFESTHGTPGANVIKMIEGEALVTESTLTAGAENLMDSSFTMEGYGAYQMFDSTSACAATLGTLVYSAQGPLFVAFNYTGLAGADRLEYSVDGTTRRALVDMPSSGSITVTNGIGMQPGAHTIQVWPVCANGDDGTPLSTNYTRT